MFVIYKVTSGFLFWYVFEKIFFWSSFELPYPVIYQKIRELQKIWAPNSKLFYQSLVVLKPLSSNDELIPIMAETFLWIKQKLLQRLKKCNEPNIYFVEKFRVHYPTDCF